MNHFGSRFGESAACGDDGGRRTLFRRNVTCPGCLGSLAVKDELDRYRFDGALCRSVIQQHVARRGNAWRTA